MADAAAVEPRVSESLERLNIDYEVLPCDPAFADTPQFCEKYGYPPTNSGNTIIVASRKEPRQVAACLVKASTRLDVNRTLRKLMGVRRLSFASAQETEALTGMAIGGVTMFGLPDELPKYVDADVMNLTYVILGSGVRSSKVKIAPADLAKLPGLQVVAGLAIEAS